MNNDKRTEILPIRLSPFEKSQLQALAENKGMKLSQYIRYMLIYSNDPVSYNDIEEKDSK